MSTPTSTGTQWRSRAACRGISDPELFFPAAVDGPVYAAQVAAAKAVCAGCPVRLECLDEALARIPEGVAGGMTAEERRALRAAGRTQSAASHVAAVELEVLELGLRPGAGRREVREAGRVLLAAGRPVGEVAARCRVSERTAARWATTRTTTCSTTTRSSGEGRGCSRALPLISHTSAQAGTRAEGTRG